MTSTALKFKAVEQGRRFVAARLGRGNVVKIKGSRKIWIVVKYDWKKGLRLTEYTGPIATAGADRAAGRVPSDYGDWVAETQVTHVAVR